MTSPHAANATARPTNPDTDLPMPSPSASQQQLVANLLARLVDELPGEALTPQQVIDLVDPLLTEAVVRQHGRTLRANLAELRATADSFDRDARATLDNALGGQLAERVALPVDLGLLKSGQQLATSGAALRRVMLRGDRA